MTKALKAMESMIAKQDNFITEINSAIRIEKDKIRKHSYRAEILDEMHHKAEMVRTKMIEDLDSSLN
jgi:uncharacterized coiled-coil protein SlyX